MSARVNQPVLPQAAHPQHIAPPVQPDVATTPHPVSDPAPEPAVQPEGSLQDVIPQVAEVAQKVGGYKNLAKIADDLDGEGA